MLKLLKIKVSVKPIENVPLCEQLQSLAGTTLITDIYHKGSGFFLFAPMYTAQYQVLHFGQQNHSAFFDVLLTVHLSIFISVLTNLMHKMFVLQ